MRQHLTAVRAAAEVCAAAVAGDALGSLSLRFVPRPVRAGEYTFAIGTAGSATLVLQTVLPPLLTAAGPSRVTVEGGTHNPMAPPVDFFERSFLPFLRRMGPKVDLRLERYGFYPAGGGKVSATVEPVRALLPFTLLERDPEVHVRARAVVANLHRSIAQRELDVVRERMGLAADALIVVEVRGVPGPGNVLAIEMEMSHHCEIATAFGRKGRPAAAVASEAVEEARAYLASGAPVGRHLADQLVVPLAMAGGGRFRTGPPSLHTTTNVEVVRRFLPAPLSCVPCGPARWEVGVGARPERRAY